MAKRKCPKCRGAVGMYRELWTDHTIGFEVQEDGTPEQSGYLEPGEPYGVEAVCDACGHCWRLRNVAQITDLRGDA